MTYIAARNNSCILQATASFFGKTARFHLIASISAWIARLASRIIGTGYGAGQVFLTYLNYANVLVS